MCRDVSAAFSERLSIGKENQTRLSCSVGLASRQVGPPSLSKVVLSCGISSMDGLLCHWNHKNLICLSRSLFLDSAKATPGLEAHMVFFFQYCFSPKPWGSMWREWQNDPVVWVIGPRRVVTAQVMFFRLVLKNFAAATFFTSLLLLSFLYECCVWEGWAHCDLHMNCSHLKSLLK